MLRLIDEIAALTSRVGEEFNVLIFELVHYMAAKGVRTMHRQSIVAKRGSRFARPWIPQKKVTRDIHR